MGGWVDGWVDLVTIPSSYVKEYTADCFRILAIDLPTIILATFYPRMSALSRLQVRLSVPLSGNMAHDEIELSF
jgi:hypothetical protein